MEWSGNDRRELVQSEIGIRGVGNFATCIQAELRDRAAFCPEAFPIKANDFPDTF
jgi:hypothetical protein